MMPNSLPPTDMNRARMSKEHSDAPSWLIAEKGVTNAIDSKNSEKADDGFQFEVGAIYKNMKGI